MNEICVWLHTFEQTLLNLLSFSPKLRWRTVLFGENQIRRSHFFRVVNFHPLSFSAIFIIREENHPLKANVFFTSTLKMSDFCEWMAGRFWLWKFLLPLFSKFTVEYYWNGDTSQIGIKIGFCFKKWVFLKKTWIFSQNC